MIDPFLRNVKKSEASQRVLDALDAYLEGHLSEPMKWLVRFWKDQAAVITYAELLEIVKEEDIPEKIFADWFGDYSRLLTERMTPLWRDSMIAAALDNPIFENVTADFNTADSFVRQWMTDRVGELVTNCLDEQRRAIRYIVAEGKTNKWSPAETARYIRPTIGLTEQQAAANQKYYNTFKEQMRENHPRMTDQSIERKAREAAGRYAAKQQRYRAETIARTEIATSYNEGNDQYVRQAIRNGQMPRMVKVWSTAMNGHVCAACQALEGTQVDMDDEFEVTVGKRVQRTLAARIPPMHPRCKCAVMYEEAGSEQTNHSGTNYQGLEDSWRDLRQNEQINDVNPEERDDNCVNCSIAYEMRRRGKAVVAGEPSELLMDNYGFACWKNPEINSVEPGMNPKLFIDACMGLWGDGARSHITLTYNSLLDEGGVPIGHSFVAEQRNGATYYIDPQFGMVYNDDKIMDLFKSSHDIKFCRVDQLEISDLGFSACKEVI